MGASNNRTIVKLTESELRNFIYCAVKDALRRQCYVGDDGWLVFESEEAWAEYLDKLGVEYPSEVNACFIDEHPLKVYWSDHELKPHKRKRIERAERNASIPADEVKARLRELWVDV